MRCMLAEQSMNWNYAVLERKEEDKQAVRRIVRLASSCYLVQQALYFRIAAWLLSRVCLHPRYRSAAASDSLRAIDK